MISEAGLVDCRSGSSMAAVKRQVDNIVKSAEDKRLYRALELTNDLKVLLISDGTTDKSAASLDVNVGHLSDPKELPGLAHFLEHMLFLGTEKYPSENEYSKFLSEHGGAFNACTFADHTNYYFDVVPEQLAGALDRYKGTGTCLCEHCDVRLVKRRIFGPRRCGGVLMNRYVFVATSVRCRPLLHLTVW
ncbi:hypothetical protein PR048_001837 [Dryococelus australis]|uniref:Peptidase M16 N-terminal domain-containing protein n=1 Tax=Dryococelus australis TaxID=614101 RepID=A0ABQ9IIG9_9NEOP|nr:hypothetical protein PR048_001837 [Dryococelus australis]